MLINFFELRAQPLSGILPKFGSYVDQTTVDFEWNSKTATVDYTVVLAQDPTFSNGLIQSPALTTTTWQSFSLGTGVWYWKVVSNDGLQLSESGVNFFRIFKPTDLSNNTLWLAGDGNMQLSGSSVTEWTDMSGLGNNFSQSTPADQPAVTNIPLLNNKQVVHFDGGSDYLNAGNVLNVGANSITTFVLSFATGSIYSKFGSGSSPFNIHSCYNLATEQGIELAGNNYQNFFTSKATNYHILSFRANRTANNAQMRRNMSTVSSGVISGLLPLATYNFTNNNPFLMGRYAMSGSPFYLNGDIAEVIFYDRSLTDTERGQVENYLNDKYAPGINLSKDTTLANFCPYTITAPSGYTNLLWSTGETTTSITVAAPGEYWLRGTNLFGVMSYDTILVNHPEIADPVNLGICANGSNIWNVDLGPGFTYLWSDGSTSPSLSIATPGTYSVEVTGPGGCSKNSGDYTFSIDNYPLTAFLGNDTTLCSGNLISLQIGAAETVSYLWPNSSTGSIYSVDTTGNYYLESININDCIAQDTIHITVMGTAPVADFSASNACLGSPNNFTDLSIPQLSDPIAIWDWDLGDGNTASTQNPSYAYANSGTYSVDLYVETVGGCGASQSHTVTVFDPPHADFDYSGNCSADVVQFMDQTSVGSSTIASWLWNFGQPSSGLQNVSVINSPTKTYNDVGTFMVYLQVTDDNGCSDDTTVNVTLVASPMAGFTASDACENTVIPFNNTSVAGFTYLWNFGDATTSILPNPSHTYTSYGAKTVLLTATAANGCTASFQDQVYIHPVPIPAISVGPLCSDTYVPFIDQSFLPEGSIATSMWVVNAQDTVYGLVAGYQFDALGQQGIQLTTNSATGCTASTSQFVDPQVTLNAGFDSGSGVLAANETFTFLNTTTNPTSSNWQFGDGSTAITFSPTHEYTSYWTDSTVMVTLVVSNALGCTDTVQHLLQIRPSLLDLALTNLYLQNNNGFYSLGVQLKNEGSLTINAADLEVVLPKGPVVSETWTGVLQPGMTAIYVFNSQPNAFVSTENATDDFICVEGIGHDDAGTVELALSNNKICRNTEGEQVVLLPVYPNPASDEVTVQVLVSVSSEVTLDLTDSRGRLVKTMLPTQTLSKGLYSYTIDLKQVEAGTYFVRMMSGDQEVMMKLMVM